MKKTSSKGPKTKTTAKNESGKKALGKGLSALFGDQTFEQTQTKKKTESVKQDEAEQTVSSRQNKKNIQQTEKEDKKDTENQVLFVEWSRVHPDRSQPRKNFPEEQLKELAQSIRVHGILQPIIVSKDQDDQEYTIIAGERRWRAAHMAELEHVPVLIREVDDQNRFVQSVIENIQREDLDPVDEAKAYMRLIEEFGLTQVKLSEILGKSRSSIANAVRILQLSEYVQDLLSEGDIHVGHAKLLLSVEDEDVQIALAEKCRDAGLSVRDLERMVERYQLKKQQVLQENKEKQGTDLLKVDAEQALYKKIERFLSDRYATKTHIKQKKGKGQIIFEYQNEEDLDHLLSQLGYLQES